MNAVNYTTLRDNMKLYFDRIAEDREPMIVTRKGENMVIMSQGSYDSLIETLYLLRNRENYAHLMRSVEQHQNGLLTERELVNADD